MERRSERRFAVNKNVQLQVLGRHPGPAGGKSVDASIVNLSGNGMRLHMQFPVACGASVEITDKDTIIVGTVCSCMPQDAIYSIGIRIEQYIRPIHGHGQLASAR
jgi:hypothetical protein